jgi:hypothetical protein
MAPLSSTAHDPRTARALELAAGAGAWLRMTDREGRRFYGIRSSDGRHVYYTRQDGCTCPDARHRGGVCKHQLAVRLVCTAARAVERNARPTEQRAKSDAYAAIMAAHFGEEG